MNRTTSGEKNTLKDSLLAEAHFGENLKDVESGQQRIPRSSGEQSKHNPYAAWMYDMCVGLMVQRLGITKERAIMALANAAMGLEFLYAGFLGIATKEGLDLMAEMIPGDSPEAKLAKSILTSLAALVLAAGNLGSDLLGANPPEEVEDFLHGEAPETIRKNKLMAKLKDKIETDKTQIKSPTQLRDFLEEALREEIITVEDKNFLTSLGADTLLSASQEELDRLTEEENRQCASTEEKESLCMKKRNEEAYKQYVDLQKALMEPLSHLERYVLLEEKDPTTYKRFQKLFKFNYLVFIGLMASFGSLADVFPVADLFNYFNLSQTAITAISGIIAVPVCACGTTYYLMFSSSAVKKATFDMIHTNLEAFYKMMLSRGWIGIEFAIQFTLGIINRGVSFAFIVKTLGNALLGLEDSNPGFAAFMGLVLLANMYVAGLTRGGSMANKLLRTEAERKQIEEYKKDHDNLPVASLKESLFIAMLAATRGGSAATLLSLITFATEKSLSPGDFVGAVILFTALTVPAYLGNKAIKQEDSILEAIKEVEKAQAKEILQPAPEAIDGYDIDKQMQKNLNNESMMNTALRFSAAGRVCRWIAGIAYYNGLAEVLETYGIISAAPSVPMLLATNALFGVFAAILDKYTFDENNKNTLALQHARWKGLVKMGEQAKNIHQTKAILDDLIGDLESLIDNKVANPLQLSQDNNRTKSGEETKDTELLKNQELLAHLKEIRSQVPEQSLSKYSKQWMFMTQPKSEIQRELTTNRAFIKKAKEVREVGEFFAGRDRSDSASSTGSNDSVLTVNQDATRMQRFGGGSGEE